VSKTIRFRTLVTAITCGAALLIVGLGVGSAADSPAVTGNATSVTGTSAQLNGTVAPGGLDTFWAFQYGTSTNYSQTTPTMGPFTGTSTISASTLITGLTPGTTYHFRLIVIQGEAGTSGESTGYLGADETLTTGSSGTISTTSTSGGAHAKASLLSRTLRVKRGAVMVPWGCSGTPGAGCKLTMSLSARAAKHGSASCGSGTFVAATGKHHSVRIHLASKCRSLVKAASKHRLGATLKATSSIGHLKVGVTLVG
jgi:hypothetical protein